MANSAAIDVATIVQQKENITPLPGGRAASKLAANFESASKSMAQFKELQQQQREDYETKLQNCDELDDPLQAYVDYIKWTHDNFPQGSNAESGLLALLERCTSCFRDTPYYKNDPRYLKVWLEYTNYSDSPREIFVYLAKKEIGNQLALYYEEFASYLEMSGKTNDARQVYEMGIEIGARPLTRLEKTYKAFEERAHSRIDQSPPSSMREVLSVKKGSDIVIPADSSLSYANINNKKRQKLQVFNDELSGAVTPSLKESLLDTSGSKDLGTIKARIKENVFTAKPWKGEMIKQKLETSRPSSSRFEVFRDEPQQSGYEVIQDETDQLSYTIIRQPGKNTEKISINMDLIYPSPDEEYCIEEILAMSRRFDSIRLQAQKSDDADISPPHIDVPQRDHTSHTYTVPLKDEHIIIPLNDEPVTKPSSETSKSDDNDNDNDNDLDDSQASKAPNSPTITMYTKAASNEVYHMFNDAAQNLTTDDEFDGRSEQENTTNYDGFVTETLKFTTPATYTNYQHEAANANSAHITEDASVVHAANQMGSRSKENNENFLPAENPSTPPTDHFQSEDEADSVKSSPFIERPSNISIAFDEKIIYNVSDPNFRLEMMSQCPQPISNHDKFYSFRHTAINKLSHLESITDSKSKIIQRGPASIINYCGDENYCARYELGRGGYGVVYLVETEKGHYKALKLESPATEWEFYILSEIHKRIEQLPHPQLRKMKHSFVRPESLSLFQDESYLVLNYVNQGTLLDVVNLFKDEGEAVDEALVIYLTIELLKVVESLHSMGIIHGDFKADNCMVRLDECQSWSSFADESDRIRESKGITMIDFGRAIDMTLVSGGGPTGSRYVQFISEWTTDDQDCPGMRQGEPWSYDADYYGVAAIIHTLLFGEYIQVNRAIDGRYKLVRNLKRWWQTQLWAPLFDVLLNPYYGKPINEPRLPMVEQVELHRKYLEQWLSENGERRHLKHTFAKIEHELNARNYKLLRSLK